MVVPDNISPAKLIPPVISKNEAVNTKRRGDMEGITSLIDSKTIILIVVKKITVVPISKRICEVSFMLSWNGDVDTLFMKSLF